MEVIFTYTDEDAQDDGVLVPLSKVDRVTRSVFDRLEPLPDLERLSLCRYWLTVWGSLARHIYDQNIGGGIWRRSLEKNSYGDPFLAPVTTVEIQGLVIIWIMPNELGGLTIMLPEDY